MKMYEEGSAFMYRRNMVLTVLAVLFLVVVAGCGGVPATIDPYVAVEQANQTAEAAQDKVQYYSSQLTATAQAPIVEITQTAAAFEMQMMFVSATAQSIAATETVAVTQTAMAWTPTPNATMTAVFANSYAEATQIANEIELSNLEVERAKSTNFIRAMAAYVIGFVALVGALMWCIGLARKKSVYAVPMSEYGDKQPILVDGIVIDPDRMPNGMAIASPKYVASLPAITEQRQADVTNRDQVIDLRARTSVKSAAVQKLLETNGLHNLLDKPQNDTPLLNDVFPLPEWNLINGWNGEKSLLPYGITASGLDFVNIDEIPHVAVISMTGMGKTRRLIRPFVACALAAGHRVVIVGKSTDYWVFENHVNVKFVKVSQITEPSHAERYAAILRAVVQEMNKRDDYLTSAKKSTWSHAGRERTFVVLDELGNALRLMPPGLSDEARIWVEGLVAEGRKVGFNVLLANQRATGMAAILSQTGKAIFRVEKDEEKGHRSLVGASDLREGYFFAKFGASKLAGAFEPSDEEIQQFLERRPVKALENDWVDAEFSVVKEQLPLKNEASAVFEDRSRADSNRVLELHRAGKSMSAIVWDIWKVSGGSSYRKRLEEVKAILSANTSTTTVESA